MSYCEPQNEFKIVYVGLITLVNVEIFIAVDQDL